MKTLPVVGLLVLSVPGIATGQVVQIWGQADACGDCLELTHTLSVGETDGPGFLEVTQHISLDRAGQVWVGLSDNIKVFGPDGRFVRELGRKGEGPGEFRGITEVATDPDGRIHVFDWPNRRNTIFSPDGEILNEWRIPGRVPEAVFLGDGQIVANIVSTNPDMVGLPVHILEPVGGAVLRSLGAEEGEHFNTRERWPGYRNLALGKDGVVWTASRTRYRLRAWDLSSGEKTRVLERTADWFQPNPAENPPAEEQPLPAVESIGFDSDGHLLVLTAVAALDWKDHMVPKQVAGRIIDQPDSMDGIYDTIIEVVDPESGQLLASQRFPDLIWGCQGGILFGLSEDDMGVPRVEFWQLKVSVH